jgi:hypothetical protein
MLLAILEAPFVLITIGKGMHPLSMFLAILEAQLGNVLQL